MRLDLLIPTFQRPELLVNARERCASDPSAGDGAVSHGRQQRVRAR